MQFLTYKTYNDNDYYSFIKDFIDICILKQKNVGVEIYDKMYVNLCYGIYLQQYTLIKQKFIIKTINNF